MYPELEYQGALAVDIVESLFQSLLTAGRTEQFDAIRSLPGAGVHAEVLRLADTYRGALLKHFEALDHIDRVRFIKAVAIYENTVGGLGSVTTLHRLLPLLLDDDHVVLDWILANTKSYWYYAHGASSFAELQALNRAQANRRVESLRQEDERAAAARSRRAVRASMHLYNAVRRGDTLAVKALLAHGADPKSYTPDGMPLHQYALTANRIEIAALLADKSNDEIVR